MADFDGVLNPAAGWPDIPQASDHMKLLGGEGGPLNSQAEALAARTKFLKEDAQAARNNLAAMDGAKLVGACPDIATLRTIEPTENGQRITVIGYYADTPLRGGGDFIHDAADTTTPDDGVLTIVSAGGKRWKRRNPNRLGRLCALDAGARADSTADLNAGTGLATGTDNSAAQIRADRAADLLGCRVSWPGGKYRFTQPFERRVVHEGNYSYTSTLPTIFILDNAVATTWLAQMPGRTDGRQQDIHGIWFYSAQVRIHRLLDGGFYRGSMDNVRVSRFDIGLDVSAVYLWMKKCFFDNNNKGVYPRALHGTPSLASTMLGFEECVFIANTDVGFLSESRPFGVDAAAKELLNVHFVRCGFEQNARGLVATNRIWYLGLHHCWFEANTTVGCQITNSYSDVYDIGTRFDDPNPPVFPPHRHFKWDGSGLEVNAIRTTNLRAVTGIVENVYGSVVVKQDGTVSNPSGLPVTATINGDNSLRLVFSSEIAYPMIAVTPVIRGGAALSYSLLFDNTSLVSAVVDSDRINVVTVKCFDPAAPGTIVKPFWWNVHIGWPSNANVS
ncbi:hypothetical protein [Aeromonas caviae]|uniref:hypothetical protein n=1 Tax=Aeromonas caviae TaxID=648 RepID=UPI002B4750C0|nr:hypothetical protein [Aeromonas caviae]